MAGTIIADFIRADANKFSINVGNTIIASVNALGILSNTGNVMISSAGVLEANSVYYNGSSILTSGRVKNTLQPANSVLQVVQVTANDVISASGTSFADIPTLQVTITPTASTSKFLLIPNFQVGASVNYQIMFRAYRVVGGTETWIGASVVSGTRTQTSFTVGSQAFDNYVLEHTSWQYLDSPATTSAITYKFKWADPRDGGTHFIGRSYYDADGAAVSRSTSLFTVMEIAG